MKKKEKKPIDTTKVSGGANENLQNFVQVQSDKIDERHFQKGKK